MRFHSLCLVLLMGTAAGAQESVLPDKPTHYIQETEAVLPLPERLTAYIPETETPLPDKPTPHIQGTETPLPDKPTPHIRDIRATPKLFRLLAVSGFLAVTYDTRLTIKTKAQDGPEIDPVLKPIVELPNPAYVAMTYVLISGLDLVSWKMERSNRFHKIWWVPLVLQIGGNTWGAAYTAAHGG
jgi:hypothetical protein